ncbi:MULTISPECIES: hypothetical protein [Streptomyces]|uniref:hypothetical protein n=1 Tax=Streptomyces TaxID=1883 RepID=UPI001071B654|nr:hypothetical protein [Streptomyces sp. 4R-3d]TFI27336.1 hypothetical protein E4P36_14615 [Streptomyces sp. 4R-3d]
MNGREGTAHLEWWANPSTCLVRIPVRVTSAPGGAAWNAALSPGIDGEGRESVQDLIDADPFCTLHFDDGSAVNVEAAQSGDVNYLWLRVVLAPDSGV